MRGHSVCIIYRMQVKKMPIRGHKIRSLVSEIMTAERHLQQKIYFCWRLESHLRKEQDPDLLIKGIDPRIRIRTKMSQTRNIGRYYYYYYYYSIRNQILKSTSAPGFEIPRAVHFYSMDRKNKECIERVHKLKTHTLNTV